METRRCSIAIAFQLCSEYAIRNVQAKQDGMGLNGTYERLVYVDDISILGGSVHTVKINTGSLVLASKEIGLEVNAYKYKYMVMSPHQNGGQNHNIKCDNNSFEISKYIFEIVK
jgi:hypothetical protein